jgi:hypothetical protein
MQSEILVTAPTLSKDDRAALALAVRQLEHVSLAARLTNLLGKQIELAGALIPRPARAIASKATTIALRVALRTVLKRMDPRQRPASHKLHKALAAGSGAIGGALGFSALPVELPASTLVMLRAIADIARAEGEDINDPETALACLQVFAMGGRSPEDDALESSYFAIRAVLAQTVAEAAKYMLHKGAIDANAPVLVRLISLIAARFGLVVSQKMAAQLVPVIGAMGGAAVNYAFVDHFQNVAKGHFTVRRLERAYGADKIKAEYELMRL